MKKILKETDPRFHHLERKVGFFVTISLVLALLLFMGMKHDIFTPKYTLFFTADRGRGISEGMPVKLSGFKIGKVSSLSLDEQARVRVEMAIYKKYTKWIRQDATAKLIKEGGLWGDDVIEITGGSQKFPPIENKNSMNFERSKDLQDVVEELKPTLAEIKGMINYVNDPQGDVRLTLVNIRKLSEQFLVTRAQLDKLLINSDKSVVELNKTVAQLDTAITTVNKDLPRIMSNLSKSAENIEKLTAELNRKAPVILDDTKEILEGTKKSWPVNTMVAPAQEKPLKGDSFE